MGNSSSKDGSSKKDSRTNKKKHRGKKTATNYNPPSQQYADTHTSTGQNSTWQDSTDHPPSKLDRQVKGVVSDEQWEYFLRCHDVRFISQDWEFIQARNLIVVEVHLARGANPMKITYNHWSVHLKVFGGEFVRLDQTSLETMTKKLVCPITDGVDHGCQTKEGHLTTHERMDEWVIPDEQITEGWLFWPKSQDGAVPGMTGKRTVFDFLHAIQQEGTSGSKLGRECAAWSTEVIELFMSKGLIERKVGWNGQKLIKSLKKSSPSGGRCDLDDMSGRPVWQKLEEEEEERRLQQVGAIPGAPASTSAFNRR